MFESIGEITPPCGVPSVVRRRSPSSSTPAFNHLSIIRRMIDKWLKAGVLEDGLLRLTTEGTPQGGVISPMLSNIYLHHVLDEWFENEVKPRLQGTASLVRYADDFVMTFETHHDA